MRIHRLTRAATAVVVLAAATVPFAPAHADQPNGYVEYNSGLKGGEPSIGYDPHANAAMYGAGTKVSRLTWDDSVTPATMKTVDVTPATSVTTLDAITIVDQNTHRSFNSQLAAVCSIQSYSDDAGATWQQTQGCGENTLLDHESVGAGPFHAPLTSTPLAQDAVYYCAQNGFNATCAVSLDGGLTYGPGQPITNSPGNASNDPSPTIEAEGGACSGLHGHLRVGPDGTAYVPIKGCGGTPTADNLTNDEYAGGHPAVSISSDNGTTWQISRVDTGNNSDESDPSVGIAKDNTLYFGWQDGTNPNSVVGGSTSSARIAVSRDDGKTWAQPVDVSSGLGINNVQFPEVIAGDGDRAAFAFLGTPAVGDDQQDNFVGEWHLYVATTYDGGATWSTVDATPGDPVQRGCIDLQGIAPGSPKNNVCSHRNLLDFNDITVDGQGRVLVAYAKGCTGSCVTDPGKPVWTNLSYVARQSFGRGLYAQYDGILPGSGPAAAAPEVPLTALLPLAAVGVLGAARLRRRRPRK